MKYKNENEMKWNLKSDFADVVMKLIGDEITTLDAFVYADKYLEYFGVNDTKCYLSLIHI